MPGNQLNRFIKPAAIVATLALVGFLSYAVYSAETPNPRTFPAQPPPTRLRDGRHAPSFELRGLGDTGLVAFRGRASTPVIVNFFASWCSDCVAELDAFGKISNESTGVRFIGVDSLDSDPSLAMRLLARAHIRYPIGVDRNGAVTDRYLISGLPVTFFVSRSGVIEGEIFGTATSQELAGWVHSLGGLDRR
jgi:cytochrome c biogenesis protein CcmG, thiol:disulfide interchange protein DsbE